MGGNDDYERVPPFDRKAELALASPYPTPRPRGLPRRRRNPCCGGRALSPWAHLATMRSRNGVKVMSTSENSSPRKYGPPRLVSSSSIMSSASTNIRLLDASLPPDVSHCIHRLNSARSSLSFPPSARVGVSVLGGKKEWMRRLPGVL